MVEVTAVTNGILKMMGQPMSRKLRVKLLRLPDDFVQDYMKTLDGKIWQQYHLSEGKGYNQNKDKQETVLSSHSFQYPDMWYAFRKRRSEFLKRKSERSAAQNIRYAESDDCISENMSLSYRKRYDIGSKPKSSNRVSTTKKSKRDKELSGYRKRRRRKKQPETSVTPVKQRKNAATATAKLSPAKSIDCDRAAMHSPPQFGGNILTNPKVAPENPAFRVQGIIKGLYMMSYPEPDEDPDIEIIGTVNAKENSIDKSSLCKKPSSQNPSSTARALQEKSNKEKQINLPSKCSVKVKEASVKRKTSKTTPVTPRKKTLATIKHVVNPSPKVITSDVNSLNRCSIPQSEAVTTGSVVDNSKNTLKSTEVLNQKSVETVGLEQSANFAPNLQLWQEMLRMTEEFIKENKQAFAECAAMKELDSLSVSSMLEQDKNDPSFIFLNDKLEKELQEYDRLKSLEEKALGLTLEVYQEKNKKLHNIKSLQDRWSVWSKHKQLSNKCDAMESSKIQNMKLQHESAAISKPVAVNTSHPGSVNPEMTAVNGSYQNRNYHVPVNNGNQSSFTVHHMPQSSAMRPDLTKQEAGSTLNVQAKFLVPNQQVATPYIYNSQNAGIQHNVQPNQMPSHSIMYPNGVPNTKGISTGSHMDAPPQANMLHHSHPGQLSHSRPVPQPLPGIHLSGGSVQQAIAGKLNQAKQVNAASQGTFALPPGNAQQTSACTVHEVNTRPPLPVSRQVSPPSQQVTNTQMHINRHHPNGQVPSSNIAPPPPYHAVMLSKYQQLPVPSNVQHLPQMSNGSFPERLPGPIHHSQPNNTPQVSPHYQHLFRTGKCVPPVYPSTQLSTSPSQQQSFQNGQQQHHYRNSPCLPQNPSAPASRPTLPFPRSGQCSPVQHPSHALASAGTRGPSPQVRTVPGHIAQCSPSATRGGGQTVHSPSHHPVMLQNAAENMEHPPPLSGMNKLPAPIRQQPSNPQTCAPGASGAGGSPRYQTPSPNACHSSSRPSEPASPLSQNSQHPDSASPNSRLPHPTQFLPDLASATPGLWSPSPVPSQGQQSNNLHPKAPPTVPMSPSGGHQVINSLPMSQGSHVTGQHMASQPPPVSVASATHHSSQSSGNLLEQSVQNQSNVLSHSTPGMATNPIKVERVQRSETSNTTYTTLSNTCSQQLQQPVPSTWHQSSFTGSHQERYSDHPLCVRCGKQALHRCKCLKAAYCGKTCFLMHMISGHYLTCTALAAHKKAKAEKMAQAPIEGQC